MFVLSEFYHDRRLQEIGAIFTSSPEPYTVAMGHILQTFHSLWVGGSRPYQNMGFLPPCHKMIQLMRERMRIWMNTAGD